MGEEDTALGPFGLLHGRQIINPMIKCLFHHYFIPINSEVRPLSILRNTVERKQYQAQWKWGRKNGRETEKKIQIN